MVIDTNSNPGDETRRNGDYVGLPHTTDEDGSNGPDEGELVTFDGTTISTAAVPGDGTGDELFGVLYTYQYFGDTQAGRDPKLRTDRNATVKTSGTVVVDVSGLAVSVSEGDVLGPNGEVLVLNQIEGEPDHFEVLLR